MPLNSFSVGRDISLDVIVAGRPLQISLITDFSSRPEHNATAVKGLDGIIRHLRFPDGWSGSMSIARTGPEVEQYFAQVEDNYYAGLNETAAQITETIQEPNGSVSRWRYTGVMLKMDDRGTWSADNTVNMRISFMASRRVRA